jgi:hypothetical protein
MLRRLLPEVLGRMKHWATAFVGLNITDAFLTLILVGRGHAELNPLWAAILPEDWLLFVTLKALLSLVAAGVMLHYRLHRPLVACAAAMWAVVLWNTLLLFF